MLTAAARPGRQRTSDRSSLLVVHDQAAFGEALAHRLAREDGLEVVASVRRPLRALVLVPAKDIGTCLIDWDLEDGAADTLAAQLRALDRAPLVVALGSTDDPAVIVRALRAGACAWVPKESSIEVLLEALRCTAAGQTWLPGALLAGVLAHLLALHGEPAPSTLDLLTARELDVLRCMVAGLGQGDIAARLYLSPNTVRTHRRRTLAKLGVHSSLEAVFVARRAGLTVDLPPSRGSS